VPSLRAQTRPPAELVIALDHPDDDSPAAVLRVRDSLPYPVRILDVHVPRPDPPGASAIPDNCLIHAATGDALLHLDDDLEVPPNLCAAVDSALSAGPECTIWPQTNFADIDPGLRDDLIDSRARNLHRKPWPRHPGGFVELPRNLTHHWGAAWCAPTALLRRAGGHNLAHAGFHNTDTRLGTRLARLAPSYLATGTAWRVIHHGPTWYTLWFARHRRPDPSRSIPAGPPIANGGDRFWTSAWFDQAYSELDTQTHGV